MKRSEVTDELVQKVGDGIREYNRCLPPTEIRFGVQGRQLPPSASEIVNINRRWYEAVRHGLLEASTP